MPSVDDLYLREEDGTPYPDHVLPEPCVGVGVDFKTLGLQHKTFPELDPIRLCNEHDPFLNVRCQRLPHRAGDHAGTAEGVGFLWP